MAILLPPSIEGKLPAQVGSYLTIPYQHNRAVGYNDYKDFCLKITGVSTGADVAVLTSHEFDQNRAKFYYEKLIVGQYYKAQLAYIDNTDTEGYYSTIGVFKYTAIPTVTVELGGICCTELKGTYTPNDPTEKLYSYRFDIYDAFGTLFESSGDIIANSATEFTYLMQSVYGFNQEYKVQLTTISVNAVEVSKNVKCYITVDKTIKDNDDTRTNITITTNNDTGALNINWCKNELLELTIVPDPDKPKETESKTEAEEYPNRQYLLLKTHNNKREIVLVSSNADTFNINYVDYDIEQGECYQYETVCYLGEQKVWLSDDTKPGPVEDRQVAVVDFEDMFISDGQKQLCIKFNPKVSSFKNTILESKIDSLGGRFPIFFRNGNVNYKDFPVSGLISYEMDRDSGMFQNQASLFLLDRLYPSINYDAITPKKYYNREDGKIVLSISTREAVATNRIDKTNVFPINSSMHSLTHFNYDKMRGKRIKLSFEAKAIIYDEFGSLVDNSTGLYWECRTAVDTGRVDDAWNGAIIREYPKFFITDQWNTFEYVIEEFPMSLPNGSRIEFFPTSLILNYANDKAEEEIKQNFEKNNRIDNNGYTVTLEVCNFTCEVVDNNEYRNSTPSNSAQNNIMNSTNLTGDNIKKERDFRLEVLKWLNNGQPKLFRSPTEGNYIIRLMNVSLSPEDQLGRMIYSFQANAYEIAEYNTTNLKKYNLILSGGK